MSFPKLWRLVDAIEWCSSILIEPRPQYKISVPDFPLILNRSSTATLRPVVVRRLAKLVKEVHRALDPTATNVEGREWFEALCLYDQLLNDRELVPSCVDALRAMDSIRSAMPQRATWNATILEANKWLLRELTDVFLVELNACSEQLRTIRFGSRGPESTTDYASLRLDTYPRLWSLSTCPPDVLPSELASESMALFRLSLEFESEWLDTFYPAVTLDKALWTYYSAVDLLDFIEAVEAYDPESVTDALNELQSDGPEHLECFLEWYRPYLAALVKSLKSGNGYQNPLTVKVAIDFTVPFMRMTPNHEEREYRDYKERIRHLMLLTERYSAISIDEIHALQKAIEATFGNRKSLPIGGAYSCLEAVVAGAIDKEFKNFARVFRANSEVIRFPTTAVSQFFRDTQVALRQTIGPVGDDIWEERGYLATPAGIVRPGKSAVARAKAYFPPGSNEHASYQELLDIAVSEDWDDWDKHVSALARSLVDSYIIDQNPPNSDTFRDYIKVWIGSSLERTAVARRVIQGAFLYLKRRRSDTRDPHTQLKELLRYDRPGADPDKGDGNYRNHLNELKLSKSHLDNLVPSTSELWPGENRWIQNVSAKNK